MTCGLMSWYNLYNANTHTRSIYEVNFMERKWPEGLYEQRI